MILKRIDENFDSLTPTQKKAAYYIKHNVDEIASLSAKAIANKSGTSEPTLHRLAKLLNYDSYTAMHKDIKNYVYEQRVLRRLKQIDTTEQENLNWHDKHFYDEINNLEQTKEASTKDNIRKGSRTILKSNHIYVAGWRMGLSISSPLAYVLNYLLGNATFVEEGQIAEYAARMTKKDVLIISGYPRYCNNTLALCKLAKEKRVKIIAFTDTNLSPFHSLAEVTFLANNYSNGFLDSYVAPTAIMNLLIKQIAYDNKEVILERMNEIEKSYKQLGLEYNWEK